MRIECDITGIDAQPALLSYFDLVIRDAARRVSIDPDALGRVVVASQDRFGKAVDSIRPGATHTNTASTIAAGKTLARREDGRIVPELVLQSFLFESLADVIGDGSMCGNWSAEQQQALYVICHELGHALDFQFRDDDLEYPDPRSRPLSIAETAEYYGNIVLTEFAACRNASSVMTDELFSHEFREATSRIMACRRQVGDFLADPNKLTPPGACTYRMSRCMVEHDRVGQTLRSFNGERHMPFSRAGE